MSTKLVKNIFEKIQAKREALWEWQTECTKKNPPPFYCSIDLRDSGHKIVPVDSNLYPAGFNNICPEDLRIAPGILKLQIESLLKFRGKELAKKILILPESHTQNSYYIENLYYLEQIVQLAGFETIIGWYGQRPDENQTAIDLTSASGKNLKAIPIKIQNGVLSAGDFTPDLILLNNDFSGGYPEPLDAVIQPILPSHTLGWHSRKKSEHFHYYNELAGKFSEIIGIDPWTIQIDTEEVTPVNFNENLGTDRVAEVVGSMLERTKKAYVAHQVEREPFVFVKNNAGTYGMGIMVAHSAQEIKEMNRRTKNKMSMGKNKMLIESIVVQEGVPTATVIDRLAAEPVIYLFGCHLIGGFLRTNTEKSDEDNLNSQGMVFKKLCMSDLRDPMESISDPEPEETSHEPMLELVYGSIARLSAMATGMELARHARENN